MTLKVVLTVFRTPLWPVKAADAFNRLPVQASWLSLSGELLPPVKFSAKRSSGTSGIPLKLVTSFVAGVIAPNSGRLPPPPASVRPRPRLPPALTARLAGPLSAFGSSGVLALVGPIADVFGHIPAA